MAERSPKAAVDTEARAALELLRNSWMLALRADGKSKKTLKTYRESVDQLIAFLASPPPLPDETAALVDSARPVTGARDITATHLRAFMSHLLRLHKPATANNRYRGLQQWFRWMASEEEIEYSPFAKLSPPTVPEEPVPVVPVEHIKAVLARPVSRTSTRTSTGTRGRTSTESPAGTAGISNGLAAGSPTRWSTGTEPARQTSEHSRTTANAASGTRFDLNGRRRKSPSRLITRLLAQAQTLDRESCRGFSGAYRRDGQGRARITIEAMPRSTGDLEAGRPVLPALAHETCGAGALQPRS